MSCPVLFGQIKTGEVGEANEGSRVLLSGEVIKNEGDTFFINDGSGEARIYVRDSTGIDKPRTKLGSHVEITGIVSQYDDNYRVMPRFDEDLVLVLADEAGAVAGATQNATLPRTGVDFSFVIAQFIVICYIIFIVFGIIKPKNLPAFLKKFIIKRK